MAEVDVHVLPFPAQALELRAELSVEITVVDDQPEVVHAQPRGGIGDGRFQPVRRKFLERYIGEGCA